ARADLFDGRLTIVTRADRTDLAALERICAFWEALGSRVKIMDPVEHDRVLAHTSHLPHLISAALAGALPSEYREFTATGFRSATRIASGDPSLWTAICKQNREPLLDGLAQFTGRLDELRKALDASNWNAVNDLLAKAKKVRDDLGN